MICIDSREFKFSNTCITLGKFDGIHKGHMLLINKAVEYSASHPDVSSVLFTFNMPRKSIYTGEQKREITSQCGIDIYVEYPFDEKTMNMSANSFIKDVLVSMAGVKAIVVGADFRFGHNREGDVDMLKKYAPVYGYEIEVCEKVADNGQIVSSTAIKEYLSKGDICNASKLLGRDYSIEGNVSSGKQLGRTIGFPTANIIPDDSIIMPRFGVYVSEVMVDGIVRPGVTNIGCRPTVNGDNVSVETFIKNFEEDIYGKKINVMLKKFIRPEKKFSNIDELKKQIMIDKDFA